ncbi:MAG: TraR/DksA C4-type zinc finger protein [Candidatus Paceibacterota bacterium]|jgi:RNA polymerase-binding transcription factor DksA
MQTTYFKAKLEAEKTKLESEMGSVGRKNTAVPNDWEPVPSEIGTEADLIDQADVIVSHEGNAAILADLEARYDTVLAALSRIEGHTYGMCEVCGGMIEDVRLEADPAAETCIAHVS